MCCNPGATLGNRQSFILAELLHPVASVGTHIVEGGQHAPGLWGFRSSRSCPWQCHRSSIQATKRPRQFDSQVVQNQRFDDPESSKENRGARSCHGVGGGRIGEASK